MKNKAKLQYQPNQERNNVQQEIARQQTYSTEFAKEMCFDKAKKTATNNQWAKEKK